MKKNIFLTAIVVSAILAVSCSKDNDNGTTDPVANELANLKAVTFPVMEDQQVATESGWNPRGIKKLISTRKQMVVNPMQLVNEQSTDVIFPGSVLRGDSFLQGKYDPIAISNPGEITISTSLQGKDLNVKTRSLPTISDVRQKINDLLKNNQDKIDAKNAPSYITYLANSVTSVTSFNKSFRLHVGVDILKQLVEVGFNYNPSEFRANGRDYVLIKVRQPLYNLAVDPIEPSQWGTLKNVGDTEPVYVSSIDYGRVAHLLIQTDRSHEDVEKIIDATVKVNVAKIVGVDVGGGYTEITKKWFSEGKIVAIAAGGPLSQSKSIKDFDSFIKFLETPDAESLIQSAVPIGYKVRTLKDNKEVEVRTTYIDEEFK